jgi:serine/threonine protein kinase
MHVGRSFGASLAAILGYLMAQVQQRIVDGRWVLEAHAGPGGMSEVFRAVDRDDEFGTVAVKLLPAPRESDRWAVRAFELEVQARLAPLDHPNIVPLLARGRDPETEERYLVFPWAGVSLIEVLAERGAIPWEEWWLETGRPILDALAHAHRQNVAHRDVKPGNVLIENGVARLTDFGVAKLLRQLSMGLTLNEHVSRPFAPRERDDGIHSASRDVHAWAATSYFALSGHDPGLAQIADDPYVALDDAARAARSVLPPEVDAVLSACLSTSKRPATAGALLGKLDVACGTAPASRPPIVGEVYVRLPEALAREFEEQRDLHSAEVRDVMIRNLSDVVVLPYANAEQHYRLLGDELSLRVRVTDQGRCLQVVRVFAPSGDQLERDRARGWPAALSFTLERPPDLEAAADAVGVLVEEVTAHRDAAVRRQQERQRLRPLTKWRGVLGVLRDLQGGLADPVGYRDVRRSRRSGSMVFTLDDPPPARMLGQQRIAPADGGAVFAGEVVHRGEEEVVLRPIPGSARDPLIAGELRFDTRAAQSALHRQDIALDDVLYGRTERRGLAELLAQPNRASAARPVRDPVPRQDLDADKRNALRTALGAPDLMVVKGPPGTGKTRLIAELIYQQLHAQPDTRILIASQTHVALDNALVKVSELDPTISLLRIARPDEKRVAEAVAPLRLDAQLDAWGERAQRSGQAWLTMWAKREGVDPAAVRTAMDLEALAAELARIQSLLEEVKTARTALASLRSATGSGSSAATGDTVRALTDAVAEHQAELRRMQARARELLAALTEAGQFSTRARIDRLRAAELRDRAAALAPDTPAGHRCRQLIEMLGEWHARFGSTPEFMAAALARTQVVAATCVGLGAVRGLQSVRFDLCIIDEASRATAPELLIPMVRAEHFVLVGDERQLPPHIDRELLRDDVLAPRNLTVEELREPFFAHIASELPSENVIELTVQHRMHPAIGRLVSDCFYDGRLRSATDEEEPIPAGLEAIALRPVTWITTSGLPGHYEQPRGESICNPTEASLVKTIVADLTVARKNMPLEVAILTGYVAQREMLIDRLASELANEGPLRLSVHTIDSFQGQEAEVVIYSVTRANPRGRLGFLRERPRMNVALSRAQQLLLIVGDHASARRGRGENALRDVVEHVEAHPDDCALVRAER